MNIYTRKAVISSINIVPMLDILTILLIFFIVQTEFKRQVNVLHLDVPRTDSLSGTGGDRDQVLLEIAADGTLAFCGKLTTAAELPAAIAELMKENPNASVQVSAAEGASMGNFIRALDLLNAAGLHIDRVPVRINPATNRD